ncbi:MAG: glycoside hydrolase family 5 protein [Lentisphaerae bacterium]|jgi:endoglucanase|nr:glycoside hydrolase family 5 protein [Lentisphaerota bacterium]
MAKAQKTIKENDTLYVDGNRLVNSNGVDIWLQGLALPGLEWRNGGVKIRETLTAALNDWHANCIRLPVREDFWFGRDDTTAEDGGASYRELVDELVETTANAGAYLALDLHRFKAPTQAHAEFWIDAAARYSNHPAVIFDLFNEAHSISWEVWRDGGKIDAEEKKGVVAENEFAREQIETIGHQALVDAVRETGAKNIVIAGGLDWAYDLTGNAAGYTVDDAGGNGVMYASHIYPWKSDWAGNVLCMADKAPIFIGEVGCELVPLPFEKPEDYKDPYLWAPEIIAFIQANRLHWTAWSFHPRATPRVIGDWDFTPTPFWGAFVRSALRGYTFISST